MSDTTPVGGIFNRAATILLVLTSLAPVAVVYGLSVPGTEWIKGAGSVCMAVSLVAICILLLHMAKKTGEIEPLNVSKSKNIDKDVLPFLLTYLLPLITRTESRQNVVALLAVLVLIGIALYQLQLLHVNPLLGLFGYHFYEIAADSGATYLLLTRSAWTGTTQSIRAIRLTPHLWLEVTQ